MVIEQDKPWTDWVSPTVNVSPVRALSVAPFPEGGLAIYRNVDELMGRATTSGLRELSTRVGFPVEFVEKLTDPQLQAAVINDRIQAARQQDFALAVDDGRVAGIMPAWRTPIGHSEVAQSAWDAVCEVFPEAEVRSASLTNDGMRLRLMTPRVDQITPAVGDVLRLGVDVRHRYGMELAVEAYTERLICTNGMTSADRVFGWKSRLEGRKEDQLGWLRQGVGEAVESYGDLVARAQRMAETPFDGNPSAAIAERARALRIPQSLWPRIMEAFLEEGGGSEWALLNAFTRYATHHAEAGLGSRLMRASGAWVAGFDMVTARLPRPIAMQVGAHIVEEAAV